MQPYVSEWQQKYNFELIIVSSDRKEEISKFVSKNSITGRVVLDDQGKINRQYKVQAIPSDFLYDGKGKLQDSFVGWRGNSSIKQIESRLQSM